MKRLMNSIVLGLLLTVPLLFATSVSAESIAVIVNKDNPVNSLTLQQVKMIYQDEMVNWEGGDKIEVFDLSSDNPLRQKFSNTVLGKSAAKSEEEWSNKRTTNTAKNPPTTVKSKVLVLYKVAKSKSAIGYLPASAVKGKGTIKVVAEIN